MAIVSPGIKNITESDSAELVDWKNPPSLLDLKQDYSAAKPAHTLHTAAVDRWLDVMEGHQVINAKKGRSKIVPKLVRKQAEWRYSALAEPFLSTDDLFNTAPATFEDKQSAVQNGQVLNYQINCKINKTKFIDEYVRAAVDEGTVIVKVGWEFEETTKDIEVPDFELQPTADAEATHQQLHTMMQESPEQYRAEIPIEVQQAHEVTMQQGTPVLPVQVGSHTEEQTVTTKNQPILEVCNYNNIVIDPTCNGDIQEAKFVVYSFESSLSELKKDGRYKNLDSINFDDNSILSEPDHAITDDSNFVFQDTARKQVVVKEYWGYWDIHDTGEVVPFVASWVGSTIIRLEENPYPDKELPFVLVQYLPKRRSIYGEPDAHLLEDNQRIIGAVTRGIIDVIGRSANGQQGIRKDALDITNSRKFERGEDFKFNANTDPKSAFYMETYPEIPRSALEVLNMQNNEAESLTGIKAFTQGISGQALGSTATGIRSALDATSKRELGILRRLSDGLNQIGRKVISMNAEFLEDEEIIRITNNELVAINRDDLGGKYDIKLNISTAEADNEKAQELAFMLQTMGNSLPLDMSKMVLSDIARLRKMPELAKQIAEYQSQPDPLAQQKAQLELQLLQAQIANETAKGQENAIDVQYKTAKTQTEIAKARGLDSQSDLKDLDFLEQESGVGREHENQIASLKHNQNMESKDHSRLSDLDKLAFQNMAQPINSIPQ